MKKLLLLGTIVFSSISYSQGGGVKTTEEFARGGSGAEALVLANSNNANRFGAFHFKNPKRRVEGTTHLFDQWENNGVIVLSSGKKFAIKNINLNLERNVFESKYEGGKIFTFNFNNIDRFVINNKAYKNYYYDDDVKVYEIVYQSQEFELLKGFKMNLIQGSANPMLNRSVDRYVKKEYYFIKKGEEIKPFKLKKSKVLKLLSDDKSIQKNIQEHASNNKWSFKNENDLKKIFDYSLNQ